MPEKVRASIPFICRSYGLGSRASPARGTRLFLAFRDPVAYSSTFRRETMSIMSRSPGAGSVPQPHAAGDAPQRSPDSALPSRLHSAAVTTLLIILFALLWLSASAFQYLDHASLWFAPHGLLVAILLLWKRDGPVMVWLAIFLQPMIVGVWGDASTSLAGGLWEQAAHATAHAFAYTACIRAFCFMEGRSGESYPSNVLLPIVFSLFMLFASLLSSVLGMLVHLASGEFTLADAQAVWLARWIGNFVGVMTLAPLFVFLGVRFLARFVDPCESMLVVNARLPRDRRKPSVRLCWSMALALALMPIVLALVQTHVDPNIPVSFLFLLSLAPMSVLAIRQIWSATVTAIAFTALTTSAMLGQMGGNADVFAYQANALVIAISMLYGHQFIHVHRVQARRLQRAIYRQAQLQQSAFRDPLTGVYNRRAAQQTFDHLRERSRTEHEAFGVILLDIDNFKYINDTQGHDAGDRVLVLLVETIRKSTRDRDVCIRWGGDEFLLLVQLGSLEQLRGLAELLRCAIENTVSQLSFPVTSSLGATLWQEGDDIHSMVKRADQALFESKRSGRNATTVD